MEALALSLGLSLHVGLEHFDNVIHPHVRYNNNNFIIGVYYNSVSSISAYGGYRFEPTENTGIEISAVTGYPALGVVTPMMRVTYDKNSFRLFAAPSAEKYDGDISIGAVFGAEFYLTNKRFLHYD